MKILKRNQLIILIISLMLITAGYLNFNKNNETTMTSTIANRENENTLGDAALVSSTSINQNELNEGIEENIIEENKTEEVVKLEKDYYFTTSKLERETMYSQMLETYQEIYNNINSTAEQKNMAATEISKINTTKNAIMISENLILAKGIDDIIIFVNDESISIVVKAEELLQEQIAQIQNIVSRELKAEIDKIHITTK